MGPFGGHLNAEEKNVPFSQLSVPFCVGVFLELCGFVSCLLCMFCFRTVCYMTRKAKNMHLFKFDHIMQTMADGLHLGNSGAPLWRWLECWAAGCWWSWTGRGSSPGTDGKPTDSSARWPVWSLHIHTHIIISKGPFCLWRHTLFTEVRALISFWTNHQPSVSTLVTTFVYILLSSRSHIQKSKIMKSKLEPSPSNIFDPAKV